MNIATYSPALALLYVFFLLMILMGVNIKSLAKTQRWIIIIAVIFLAAANHLLRELLGAVTYGKGLLIFLHLPTFLLFLYIAKRGIIKTAFMILTALVFTIPTIIIGNLVRRSLFIGSSEALLLSNLISYILMLLLAFLVFRRGFNYLLIHGDNRLFLIFSILPFLFYIYVFAIINLDFSSLSSLSGYLARYIPPCQIFVFYFIIPYVYKSLREAQIMKSAQEALQHKLSSADSHIAMLDETNMKMATYRHNMRHHLLLLEGLLSNGKTEQAQDYVKSVVDELDSITPQKFCANDTVNLLCSYYDNKAKDLGIELKIQANLPKHLPLSDTELCSVISNGLENALRAASQPDVQEKWVDFYGDVKQNKFLLQIKNPYTGQITMQDGLPLSSREGHGYGCHSIQTIAQQNGGLCSFDAENGMFTLRVLIALSN